MTDTQTHPILVVTGGEFDGTSFIVLLTSKDMLLGSSQDCHFQILLGNVDPVHAKVTWGPRGLLLSDALSSSGTFVNGEKIGENQTLGDGDRICLGPPGSKSSCKLLVRIPSGLALPAADDDLVLVKPEVGLAPFAPASTGKKSENKDADLDQSAPTVDLRAGSRGPVAMPEPPPPAPPPPAQSAPSAPAPSVPAPEAKKAPRPEYVTEPPSIAPHQEAEPPSPAPVSRPAPRSAGKAAAKPAAKPARSGTALYAVAALLLAAGSYFAFRVFFRSPPVVESAAPARSEPGQTITLAGKGFDPNAAANRVRFGDRDGQVSTAADNQLVVTIPPDLSIPPGGDIKIVVESRGKPSKPFPFKVYRAPRVTELEPDVAMPGEEILVKGQNLDGKPLTVNVGGMPADVKEAVPESVRVVVPPLPVTQGKVVPVNLQIGSDSAKPADLTVGYLPLVTEAKPNKGEAGEKVVIKGRGFDRDVEDNEVYFGTQPALILAASETELTVVAPAALGTEGAVTAQIHVKANGAISSSPVTYTHQRPSATIFAPRFFAAAVLAHPELAFVSTDLGPVLVLGGPENDVKATAVRAFEKAATLNALVDEAASKPPVFEVRNQPETSVGVQGKDAPILTVGAEDAAAYELPFEPAPRPKRPSVRGLAAYWAALLQDYFALFVQKQRPLAVLALSPRGRVLMDIYSAALRVPGATGVPLSVLRPLTPTMGKALRDLALVLPAEKESRVTVAVEGLWTGTMEEATGGPKTVQVRFEQGGGKLGGSLSTNAGKIGMKTPLRDVSFLKNEVRFTVDLSGSARIFTGTVQGGNLTGTITRGSEKSAGRFALKYVE